MSEKIYKRLPAVALRGLVLFPKLQYTFDVGRAKSTKAVKAAVETESREVFLVPQMNAAVDIPDETDLAPMGIIAQIRQVIRHSDNPNIRVSVGGLERARIVKTQTQNGYFVCDLEVVESLEIDPQDNAFVTALRRKFSDIFERYASVTARVSSDVVSKVLYEDDISYIADYAASNILGSQNDKMEILESLDPIDRLQSLCEMIKYELEVSMLEESIETQVQEAMDRNQKEYYLREQLKVISAQLGEGEDVVGEAGEYRSKIAKTVFMDEKIKEGLYKECDKLQKMQGNSADANVVRTYLDECLALPWGEYTKDKFNLSSARKILDSEHYSMEKVKERFIEMLAVTSMTHDVTGQIICLIGPPGVGKTSIVRSVAKAMGRKYVRMSLGGIHDEAEIRGHRRTYVGAMPGRIVSALKQAGTFNPIILLDEIDKVGNDYRGDPASALLEALDPEQNSAFMDHYIDFPIDLSSVLFITTANDASTIPAPLYDRMEVIELTSYTMEDKVQIAKKHLVKKERKKNGLTAKQFHINDEALRFLIDGYTREAGVRRLEQLVASLCRKSCVMIKDGLTDSVTATKAFITETLGPQKFLPDKLYTGCLKGVVNGLAWTSVGGEMLQVEALAMDGTGKIELTGSLGDVMKESAKAAVSYIRSVADEYGIPNEAFQTKDIHIHVPQGAVPKDGPSAGVTIATAVLSALSGRKVRQDVAMTGEISLTGRVMPIGGLKEKSMAAYKNSVYTVLIPEENVPDLWEVDGQVKGAVEFVPVSNLPQVFERVLVNDETPLPKKEKLNDIHIEKSKKRKNIAVQ